MSDYTFDELEAAHKALFSSYKKTSKVRVTLLQKPSPPKSQLTLAARNINALIIALALITEELEEKGPDYPVSNSGSPGMVNI